MNDDEIQAALGALQRRVEELSKEVTGLKKGGNKKSSKRKRSGVNSYMYWCNNMKMRETVCNELREKEGKNDMTAVATELGRRWKALPAEARETVNALCRDHNKKVEDEAKRVKFDD